jgi:hypothetical protein
MNLSRSRRLINFRNNLIFLLRGVVSPTRNRQAGGPPLVGCPRFLIQYIRSYPTYLEAVSSIRNPRTRHAVVKRDPPNMRRILGPKRDEVTGDWRKLHNEELHNLYSSPSIIRMIKSRRMRWTEHGEEEECV